jgi:membrane protein
MIDPGRELTRAAEQTANRAQVPFSLNMGLGSFTRATLKQARVHQLDVHAGNLAFRCLFAVFPALVSFFWLLKLVGATNAISGLSDLAGDALPRAASGVVKAQLQNVSGTQASGRLTLGAIVAVLLTLWAISRACAAAMTALNAMHGVDEGRPFLKRQLTALSLSVAVSALLVVALVLLVLGPAIAGKLNGVAGVGPQLHWLWLVGSWPVLLVAVTVAFALLYYCAPDVEQEFRWISAGTVVGVLAWLAFAALFSLYINNFTSPGDSYGALAGVAVLMIYLYGSSFILLLGAEINQVFETRHTDGKRDGEKQPSRQRTAERRSLAEG